VREFPGTLDDATRRLRLRADERIATEAEVVTLERDYAIWKRDQALALVGTPNEATKRDHSLSSANEAVCSLPAYHEWTVRVDAARAEQLSARIEYELALEQVRSERAVLLVEHGAAV